MIDIYRFLAFVDNLPDVRFVRDQEYEGLRLSIWDSYITNKTVRIDVTCEDISEFVALKYLTLLGYPELVTHFSPPSTGAVKESDKEGLKKDTQSGG